jgi:hypothetical protein
MLVTSSANNYIAKKGTELTQKSFLPTKNIDFVITIRDETTTAKIITVRWLN